MDDTNKTKQGRESEPNPGAKDFDVEKFARALRTVCSAISNFNGADCSMYAVIGADSLREVGLSARPVAGSAAWRVGPDDGDMITHAIETAQQMFAPVGAVKAGMYHAWIEVDTAIGSVLFDPTTFQIPAKAKALDKADGGRTTVKFAPDFLWIPKEDGARLDFGAVAQYPDEGVFSYLRKPAMETLVFSPEMIASCAGYAIAVKKCYESLLAGHEIQVIGLGGDAEHSPAPRERLYKQVKL